ncbi:hypothetical protein BGX34_002668, partial [Mortierella sp. NVP85]
MTDSPLTLFCLVDGESTSFPVAIDSTKTIGDLKKLIKTENPNTFNGVDAKNLTLWRVSLPVVPKNERKAISLADVSSKEELDETDDISDVFKEKPPNKTIHIIVQQPQPGDLRANIKKIRGKFFGSGSIYAEFLDSYVQGQLSLPVTTTGVRGLPKVLRRGMVESQGTKPNLLFLDLPDPSSVGVPVPERFRSNVLLGVLERMQAQDLPVFGVSGCGKTRTVIEMLCLQWGFYFNAAKGDLGSDDLSYLSERIDAKLLEEKGPNVNTLFAKDTTLLLFLSRLLILNYCLRVPGCRQTFSSASWTILQVCPTMFNDVFSELFRALYAKLKRHAITESELLPIVREAFDSVQESLIACNYPNFSNESKLRLVVDEAQILSDKGGTSFRSSSAHADLRPMLSPVLNGFRAIGGRGELTIIYCGTGLSIRTLHWAMSSGDGVKEYGSNTFPYIEFPGWTCASSVQSYIDRLKKQLLDDESKRL